MHSTTALLLLLLLLLLPCCCRSVITARALSSLAPRSSTVALASFISKANFRVIDVRVGVVYCYRGAIRGVAATTAGWFRDSLSTPSRAVPQSSSPCPLGAHRTSEYWVCRVGMGAVWIPCGRGLPINNAAMMRGSTVHNTDGKVLIDN